MNYFIQGFLLQASLILALGAQNIFVLESGLKQRRHLLVALVCSICDVLLIAVGVLGAASIFVKVPFLKITFGALGVLFLVYYGLKKLISSFSKANTEHFEDQSTTNLKQVLFLSLGFSLLNPHVYLDTVILIGGYSAKFAEVHSRLLFGAGAGFFSILWFFGLALFASAMNSTLNGPKAAKLIAFISGLILIVLALKLGLDVFEWIKLS